MSAIAGNPFVFCAALFCLAFFAIFAIWFVERSRGVGAPQIASPAPALARRPLT